MAESKASPQPSRRRHHGRVEGFSTPHRDGGIGAFTAVEWKAFRLRIVIAESETSLRPSESLSESASSWPNLRHHRGRVEGFPTLHHDGGIGDFAAAE